MLHPETAGEGYSAYFLTGTGSCEMMIQRETGIKALRIGMRRLSEYFPVRLHHTYAGINKLIVLPTIRCADRTIGREYHHISSGSLGYKSVPITLNMLKLTIKTGIHKTCARTRSAYAPCLPVSRYMHNYCY